MMGRVIAAVLCLGALAGAPRPAHAAADTGAPPPAWAGFAGTLDREVLRMIRRAAELRRNTDLVRPVAFIPAPPPDPPDPAAPDTARAPSRLWFGPPAPNPARGPVTFRIELPVAAVITLTVHDVAGRRIAALCEPRAAGRHLLRWGGPGDGGPAGIYFARLEVNGRVAGVRRVVVLR